MNIKEGFKRIFIAIGYLFFSLVMGNIASSENNFIIAMFGYVIGFYMFKGLCYGINWIIAGFKE